MEGPLKFDLHCHTKEGSPDGKVPVLEYARLLKEQGFDGMLITDHDSYRAYYKYLEGRAIEDFTVIRGIEYDTVDHGHFLVIMPDNVRLRLLEVRGLRLKTLMEIVHHFGGIIGCAHPYGAKFLSVMGKRSGEKYIAGLDFVEGFNSSEYIDDNERARRLAAKLDKPCVGGSDSHKTKTIGNGFSLIDAEVKSADDLIDAIIERKVFRVGGLQRCVRKHPILTMPFPLGFLFHFYNLALTAIYTPLRVWRRFLTRRLMKKIPPVGQRRAFGENAKEHWRIYG